MAEVTGNRISTSSQHTQQPTLLVICHTVEKTNKAPQLSIEK
jgi:hypothetical protein